MVDVATIDDIVDRADGRDFQPQAIAVKPDDAGDDGWVTDEGGDEKDEDERDRQEKDDDNDNNKVAKVPFRRSMG